MNAFIVLTACVAASQAQFLAAPYAGQIAGLPIAHGLPLGYANAGLPLAAPLAPPASQFQAQDEFGNVQHGYSNINSQKHEVGNAYGGVSGSYSYVDANGVLQTTNYIADGLGFRVQATNLPVAPANTLLQPEFDLVGPAPVEDTPEVAAAKAEFQAAYDEAASRTKRQAVLPLPYAGLNYGLAYAAPIAPAVATAPATLETVKLNPGHAVAYRVY